MLRCIGPFDLPPETAGPADVLPLGERPWLCGAYRSCPCATASDNASVWIERAAEFSARRYRADAWRLVVGFTGPCRLVLDVDAEGAAWAATLLPSSAREGRSFATGRADTLARLLAPRPRDAHDDARWPGEQPLAGADLREARLASLRLQGWQLEDADLLGADFSGADLLDCNLRAAELELALLRQARLVNCRLDDVHGVACSAAGVSLRQCSLRRANFGLASFSGARFEGVDLRDASFLQADLSGASFVDCDLDAACLAEARCSGARFDGCRLEQVDWRAAVDVPAVATAPTLGTP